MRAYTYLIGWKNYNLWYYGVRYTSKRKIENDLWVSYFTSSDFVANKRAELGEPDVIQIRKYFDNKRDAIKWEETVLRRMRVIKNPKWLNMNINGVMFANVEGRPRDARCRERISNKRREYLSRLTPDEREVLAAQSREAGRKGADKIGKAAKERLANPVFKERHIQSHNTPEYKEAAIKRTTEWFQNEANRKAFTKRLNDPEYKKMQSQDSKNRWADPEYRKKRADAIEKQREFRNSPAEKLARSERAKACTAKRLATRLANKQTIA